MFGRRGKLGRANPLSSSAEIAQEKDMLDITKFLLTENPHILSGFRDYTHCSFCECSKSIFHLHNDTLNIWTHLLSVFWVIYCAIDITTSVKIVATNADKAVIYMFLLFAFICFTCSTAYHTYRSHSIKMFHIFLLADVSAIAFTLYGSVTAIAYFEMRCYPDLRLFWTIGLLVLFVGTVCLVPYLLKHKMTNARTILLTSFAASGFLAHLHRAFLVNWEYNQEDWLNLMYLLVTYGAPLLGLIIRRTQVPESIYPGKFDILFSSHQLFHVCVFIGPFTLFNCYSRK